MPKFQSVLGEWWVEGSEERSPGILSRDDDQWKLDIIGRLLPSSARQYRNAMSASNPITIHGAARGLSYSLFNAQTFGSRGPVHKPSALPPNVHTGPMQHTETWKTYELLKGRLVVPETHFKTAVFGLTGASQWWEATGIKYGKSSLEYKAPTQQVATWNDFTITMFVGYTGQDGHRLTSLEEHVRFEVTRPDGFRLSDLRNLIISPMSALLAICFDCNIDVLGLELEEHKKAEQEAWEMVSFNPDLLVDETSDPNRHGALLLAERVEFPIFLPAWLSLCTTVGDAAYIAEDRKDVGGYLQSKALAVVGALESVHRVLRSDVSARLSLTDAEVKSGLKKAGFSAKNRRRVERAIYLAESAVTLETRLAGLLELLGSDFAEWFLQGQRKDWAFVTSQVRNLLAHGGTSDSGAHSDVDLLVAVYQTSLRILRLTLLVAARGLPTGMDLINSAVDIPSLMWIVRQDLVEWSVWADRLRTPSQRESPSDAGS